MNPFEDRAPWARLFLYGREFKAQGLDALACAIDKVGTPQEKTILQDAVLILESILPLRYDTFSYQWGINGLYSHDLSKDLTNLRMKINPKTKLPRDTEEFEWGEIPELKKAVGAFFKLGITPEYLHMAAEVIWMKKVYPGKRDADPQTIKDDLAIRYVNVDMCDIKTVLDWLEKSRQLIMITISKYGIVNRNGELYDFLERLDYKYIPRTKNFREIVRKEFAELSYRYGCEYNEAEDDPFLLCNEERAMIEMNDGKYLVCREHTSIGYRSFSFFSCDEEALPLRATDDLQSGWKWIAVYDLDTKKKLEWDIRCVYLQKGNDR